MNIGNDLPSVVTALTEDERNSAFFFQPEPKLHLVELCTQGHESLRANVLGVRLLKLAGRYCIPCHRHERKEKVYLRAEQGMTDVYLFVWTVGSWARTCLLENIPHVVPAGYPHALFASGRDSLFRDILVISSTRDASDIVWEQGAPELITNQHLQL